MPILTCHESSDTWVHVYCRSGYPSKHDVNKTMLHLGSVSWSNKSWRRHTLTDLYDFLCKCKDDIWYTESAFYCKFLQQRKPVKIQGVPKQNWTLGFLPFMVFPVSCEHFRGHINIVRVPTVKSKVDNFDP